MFVDNDAKLRVPLHPLVDEHGNTYYIGKLQFPGELNLETGASFMIFTADSGAEELQIGPIDERKKSNKIRAATGIRPGGGARPRNKLAIDMHPCTDTDGETFYVGEAQAPASIKLTNGLFFTFFNSIKGREELQMGRLRPHHHKDSGSGEHPAVKDWDRTGSE